MANGMLGKLKLEEVQRSRNDLEAKLAGAGGEEWFSAFKLFLRKENPWSATLVDTDVKPFEPSGLTVHEHDKCGPVDLSKIELYQSDRQKSGGSIEGNDLVKGLEGKAAQNACVLDHLYANQHLIPESWKTDEQGRTQFIYFTGTRYRRPDGSLYVRGLYWDVGQWYRHCDWLDSQWGGRRWVAVLAS